MKLAAVDIGSNAARLLISSVLEDENKTSFKKIEYVRFALRLGKDVFKGGNIGYKREAQLKKLLTVFKSLMELHEVDAFLICATSALREADNGLNVIERVHEELGITINLISGEKEAEMINNVIVNELSDDQTYLHIDVGGGSTELNIYDGKTKVNSKSFKIGSIRLKEEDVKRSEWKKMKDWIIENIPHQKDVLSVGTGGNISKIFDFLLVNEAGYGSFEDIQKTKDYFKSFSVEDRINKLKMNPDRADIVTYAADIYSSAMKWANSSAMKVPDLGLIDGIILEVYQNIMNE